MSDYTSTTDALFIGGPWDNATSCLKGQPPVFRVQTHNVSGTTTHKYWRIRSGGEKQLYLYVKENESPKRVAYTYATHSLDFIGQITSRMISQVVEQGGDERTIVTNTSIDGIGSLIAYAVTVEAFIVPAYNHPTNQGES